MSTASTALLGTGTPRSTARLTGTWRLVRLALRRDRILLPVWLVVLVALLAASVASIVGLYAGEADRLAYATIAAGNAVARAFDGPMSGTSLGAITMTETYGFIAVLIGIMSVQAVVRHTRQEEETGRAELVGSAVVGRHAPLTAAFLVAAGANTLVGVAAALTLMAHDLPVAGSVAAGAAMAGVGLCFAAVAGVTAQIASTQRGANGLGMAAIGVAFLLRAVGDALGTVQPSGVEVVSAWPSWLSPIGWGQQVRPYADDRWPVLALFALLVAVLVPLAFALRARRDVGAGLVEVRPGPAVASRWLRSPLGLAWRLQRGVLLAWASGILVLSAAFGSIGDEAGELIGTSDELAAALAAIGEAALIELFFAFFLSLLAVAAAGFTVQALLRARNEEVGGRAEPLLATGVGRTRWLLSHVAVAVLGTVALLLLAGLVAGGAHALDIGEAGQVPTLVGAALVRVPAALALGGFVVAVVGLVPRWAAALAWGALVLSLVMGQLGELLELPQAVLNVSPFTHPPALPAQELVWTPVLSLLAVALGLAALGLLALRRRDITTT
jgi:ABC-2 type transport system permease protein